MKARIASSAALLAALALAALAFAALAFAALATAATSRTEQARLLLSWNRPFGRPGATDLVTIASADTAREDTLYLTFELPRPLPAIASMNAFVYFRPVGSDSLLDFWSFKTGQPNGGSLLADFAPLTDISCQSPWPDHGDYSVSYERVGGAGRLSFDNKVIEPAESMGLDPKIRYCFARIRIAHRRAHLAGHAQPVCVEWAGARILLMTGREIVIDGGESGIVRWNSREACAAPSSTKTRPWMPRPGR